MPFLILSAGRDTSLLNQRSAILRQAGYEVVIAGNSPDLVNRLFNGDFDLVLLCASIPEEERRRLIAIATRHTPCTPVVVLQGEVGTMNASGCDRIDTPVDDLLKAIGAALSQPQEAA